MGLGLGFVLTVAGKGFIRSHAGMSVAGAVVCAEYLCQGRTFDAQYNMIGIRCCNSLGLLEYNNRKYQ